jgi:hypothetical protein
MELSKTYIILAILGVMFNLTPFIDTDLSTRSPASEQTHQETSLWDYGNPALILH